MFKTKLNKTFILASFIIPFVVGAVSCAAIAYKKSETQAMINGIGSAKADFSRNHLAQKSTLANSHPKICFSAFCKMANNAGIFNVDQVAYSTADNANYVHDAATEDKFKYYKNITYSKIFEYGGKYIGESYVRHGQYENTNSGTTKQEKEVCFLRMHGNEGASGLFGGFTRPKTGDEMANGASYQISEIYLI